MSESDETYYAFIDEDGSVGAKLTDPELASMSQELEKHYRRIANRISFDKPEGVELHEGQQVTLQGMPGRNPLPVTVVEVTNEKVYVEEDE